MDTAASSCIGSSVCGEPPCAKPSSFCSELLAKITNAGQVILQMSFSFRKNYVAALLVRKENA